MILTILLVTAACLALAMMAQGSTYVQEGNILPRYSASAIAVDTVIRVGSRVGVVLKAIAAAGTESVSFSGVHDLPALSTDAWKQGDLLWWDAGNTRLTRLGTPALWPAGIAAADKAVTTGVRATVDLNNFAGFPTQFLGCTVIDTAVDLTYVVATHGNALIIVTADAKTVTLPTGVVGMEAIVINGGADAAQLISVDLDGNEIIAGGNLAIAATKTAINTKATSRRYDFLHLVCNVAATSWRCVGRRGIWVTS